MSRADNRMRTVLDGDEFAESITNFRIIQVQEKFPHDKLDLGLSLDEFDRKHYNRGPVPQRSPSLRHRKVNNAVQEIERSNSEGSGHDCENNHGGRSSPTQPLIKRSHVQEGSVKLSSQNATNERYFILFNDLLLVAKHKSQQTLKLKERVRVSELWLSQCIEEVTDQVLPTDNKSFVIGWPTLPALCNYVASFSSTDEKEIWQTALEKTIAERKNEEASKDITVKVCNRINEDVGPQQSTLFNVNQIDDVRTVIKMALEQFQYTNEDPNDYQLWMSSKDTVLYPLIGHEIPFAIKTNHTRNMCCNTPADENNNQSPPTEVDLNLTWQFVLKRNKRGSRSPSDINKQKGSWKNPIIRKTPIMHWGSKTNKQKSLKGPAYNQNETLPPGKLFGNPLAQLSTEEDIIPKPIKEILTALFRKGPGVMGVFRKSALARAAKQLRQALDTGKEVEIADNSTIVLATVLKEFFRSLPESLICSEIFDELCNVKDVVDHTSRIDEIKRLLDRVPKENYQLLMHFLCLLHHIQRFSDTNNMNPYNLSVCVSQSIMKAPKDSQRTQYEQTSGSNDAVTFLIENFIPIFSSENEYILGPESDIQFDDGPGEDSDSGTEVSSRDRDLSLDDGDDSEKEMEPPTPEILFTPNIDSPFGHSDSSIGTNDSDELKQSLNRSNHSANLHPELTRSKSTPSSPLSVRREDEMDSGVSYENLKNQSSDMSDYDEHPEVFQRSLLRQPRHKRGFSNRSTTTELIEHKRHMPEVADTCPLVKKPEVTNKRIGGCYDHIITCESDVLSTTNAPVTTQASSPNGGRREDNSIVLKKEIITAQAQPLVHHFATESHTALECVAPAKPDVIFHNVDKRKIPAAPSYEEHIQRTQSKPVRTSVPAHHIVQPERTMQPVRTVQPVQIAHAIRKPKLSKGSQVQRHSVEDYIPPSPTPVQNQKANCSGVIRKTSKAHTPASHAQNNVTNFMQNRKTKFQNRKENNNGHNCNKTLHQRNQDQDGSTSSGHHEHATHISAEQLQNNNIENQVRNTMLATQMRNDILTTHNRSGTHSNTRFPNNTAERNEKDERPVGSTGGAIEVSVGRDENTTPREQETGTKTKHPRISVTVMSNVKASNASKSDVLIYDGGVAQNTALNKNVSSINSSGDAPPLESITRVSQPPASNVHISREGRQTFRTSAKLRLSPNSSPSRGASKQRPSSDDLKENTPIHEVEMCLTQEMSPVLVDRPETLELTSSCSNRNILTSHDLNADMEIAHTKLSPLDSTSPFSLTPTSPTVIKTDSSHTTDNSSKFQLEHALLTKATKNDLLPITQLAKNQTRDDNVKVVGAKELRRTSRKLKSEFRTFGDGNIVSTPREERRAFDMKKGHTSKVSKSTKLNGPYNTPIETLRRGNNNNNNNNNNNINNNNNNNNIHVDIHAELIDMNKDSAHCLHENNNNSVFLKKCRSNSTDLCEHHHHHNNNSNKGKGLVHRARSSSSDGGTHEAYSRMMSQEESYV